MAGPALLVIFQRAGQQLVFWRLRLLPVEDWLCNKPQAEQTKTSLIYDKKNKKECGGLITGILGLDVCLDVGFLIVHCLRCEDGDADC
jgi:hypothetical protein